MNNYSFLPTRLDKELNATSTPAYAIPVEKPLFCPKCANSQNGIMKDSKVFSCKENVSYGTVLYECTVCLKRYLVIYEFNASLKVANFKAFYPVITPSYNDNLIEDVSPRFVDMYNQALVCEHNGHIELAAIGFRSALEILIKDYAIKELNKDEKEVSGKKLVGAIETYLDSETVKSADVIRILGNDYTHYKRKYPQHDFEILKTYMGIFIQQIRVKLLIAHPPVERQEVSNRQAGQSPQEAAPQNPNTEPTP